MHSLGIRLEAADPLRLGQEVIEGLKGLLSFDRVQFYPCQRGDDILRILAEIRMSARQRERAEKRILHGNGFWDRIGQKALIPLVTESGNRCLGVYEFFGVPKDIVPGEASRTMHLLAAVIHDRLLLTKMSRTMSAGERPPAYIADILGQDSVRPLQIIQLSFHKNATSLKEGGKIFEECFPKCRMEPIGRSCSTLWFGVECPDRAAFSRGIRDSALFLAKTGRKFKSLIGHVVNRDLEEISHFQHIAKGLKTAVLAPSTLDEILIRTGADLGSQVFGRDGFRPLPGSSCAMIRFESMVAGRRIRAFCQDHLVGCHVFAAGSKCLLLHFKDPLFKTADTGFIRWAQDVFEKISLAAGSIAVAGFASTAQPLVSASFLLYASLLALLHADLLGSGQMAVFDHVTLNVHGDLLFSWGDTRGACAAYRTGLRLRPGDTNLLNSLGVCLADLRDFRQARTCFKNVLKTAPENFMALYNLSGVNLDMGNLAEAAREAEKAYRMDPRNPAVLMRLVTCWIKQNKIKKVMSLWAELASNTTLPAVLLRIFGQAALKAGDWRGARNILTRCLNMKKNDPLCLALLAKGYQLFENDMVTCDRLLTRIPEEVRQRPEVKGIIRSIK